MAPKKAVEGPNGPHLFRFSQETSQDVSFYLSMSPPASPEETRAGPLPHAQCYAEPAANDFAMAGFSLQTWTPIQVAEWMHATGFERSMIELFYENDISGATLIDLKYDDLKELGITSFGYRHRLWNEIRGLRERLQNYTPQTSPDEQCCSPTIPRQATPPEMSKNCSSPDTPEDDRVRSPTAGQRHARRGRRADDIISPAESASIVAIEQLLPKPHKCSKGENCSKWRKQQRKLAKIATEFPEEFRQINAAQASPTESGVMAPSSIVVPSIVASSDLLGATKLPPVRLEENALKVVQARDPQENVRQFLTFQHLNRQAPEDPATPPYEMFPPLSPPKVQLPLSNLRTLPKLTIPAEPAPDALSDRTAVPFRRGTTPLTAMDGKDQQYYHSIYRLGSPASEMDVPVTAIPLGPIERDNSSSVPPDMRYGGGEPISRSNSRLGHRNARPDSAMSPTRGMERSMSTTGIRARRPSFGMTPVAEHQPMSPIDREDMTPTGDDVNHNGWMKKRKTKLLRHEWHENHFRLNGTRLAMHKDEKTVNALEYIDVDDYAVACSSLSSGKLNSAFKRLAISGKKKDGDASAFAFQLVPAAEKKGILNAATGKTHHFALKTGNERIDWMRELMLAKALKKQKGGDVVHSSFSRN